MTDLPLKLNIGARTATEGFTPVDRKLGTEAFPLAYEDESADEIRASHILEHFGFRDVPNVLADWVRVLKQGSRIRIAVPDFDKIADMRDDPKRLFYAMGGQIDEDDVHRSAFTQLTLRDVMSKAGLVDIRPWTSENGDTAAHPCSLNLEGIKPDAARRKIVEVKIAALLSMPRVGFNDHWGCVIDALCPFNIPVRRAIGAFWGQCLQNMMEQCVEDKLDWILALDYDSLFTAQHVSDLVGLFGDNPEIDALAALQCRRNSDFPLLTKEGQTSIETDGQPFKVSTAHFGMTLIRVDSLAKVSKPWFRGKPGPDGSWQHDERLDPDIWFWDVWRKAGHTVYVAPSVRIGHMELMAKQFDKDMKVHDIPVREWRDRIKEPGW